MHRKSVFVLVGISLVCYAPHCVAQSVDDTLLPVTDDAAVDEDRSDFDLPALDSLADLPAAEGGDDLDANDDTRPSANNRKRSKANPFDPSDSYNVRVFSFETITATEAANTLQELFADKLALDVRLHVNSRLNQLIVRGPGGQLRGFEAILLKLEETASNNPSWLVEQPMSRGQNTWADDRRVADELMKLLDEYQLVAGGDAEDNNSASDERDKVAHELRTVVGELFDARQSRQQEHVQKLVQKIEVLQRRVEQRQSKRNEVIEESVRQLLSSNGKHAALWTGLWLTRAGNDPTLNFAPPSTTYGPQHPVSKRRLARESEIRQGHFNDLKRREIEMRQVAQEVKGIRRQLGLASDQMKQGVVTTSVVEELRTKHEQARLKLERAKLEVEIAAAMLEKLKTTDEE